MIRMEVAPPIALPPENLFRIADAPTNSAKAPPIPANPLPISSQLILANIWAAFPNILIDSARINRDTAVTGEILTSFIADRPLVNPDIATRTPIRPLANSSQLILLNVSTALASILTA